jgi:hypothetical protein
MLKRRKIRKEGNGKEGNGKEGNEKQENGKQWDIETGES